MGKTTNIYGVLWMIFLAYQSFRRIRWGWKDIIKLSNRTIM
jgi:hypothetical protein